MWSPEQYHRYRTERSRPFLDLLERVHLEAPRTIVDLGCGTGELTADLLKRWPKAFVKGIDSSEEMIRVAKTYTRPGELEFELGDLTKWNPSEPVDLLFSNAALQWVGDHQNLIPRLAGTVAPGGIFAFQMPGNFNAPSYTLLLEVMSSPRWERLVGVDTPSTLEPAWYIGALMQSGMKVTAWETTYYHILQGENAVLEWVKGTALRPVLAALDDDLKEEFLAEYGARLNTAYPRESFGTLFPFRRIFVVGSRQE
jgi:trans-aconitate 2-methyltransferase